MKRHIIYFCRRVLSKGCSTPLLDVLASLSTVAVIPGKDDADRTRSHSLC